MKKKIYNKLDLVTNINELSDEFLLENILDKNGDINGNKVTKKYLENHPIIAQYLNERYSDSTSIKETIYRIKNHIEKRPVCLQCGNSVKFQNAKYGGFSRFCCASCAALNEITRNKLKQTNLKKYGVEHNWQNKEIRAKCIQTSIKRYGNGNNFQKILKTNLKRYGVEYPLQNEECKEKLKNTCLEKYKAPGIFASNIYRNMIKQTLLEKYGVDNPSKSNIIKEKIKNTNLKKYGSISPLQNVEIRNKTIKTQFKKYGSLYVQSDKFKHIINEKHDIIEKLKYKTHKLNNSFNSSKIEQQFKEYLEQNYPNDFEYQYKSELYPFNCDFYIKSLNLYIEIQGSWIHGGHPFNKNNQEDIYKLNLWKQKNTKYYNIAIDVWCNKDIKKRNIAKNHNLNYLEIFSNNINNCVLELNKYIENSYNIKIKF